MLKKMMLMFAVIFSMVMVVNAQEVTENLEKATNDPQVATEKQKNAEIKEINTQEQAKEKEAGLELKDDTANQIKDKVAKEISEDEALGAEEDAEAVENCEVEAEEAEENGGSWFSWLWPFGGDDDDAVVAEEDESTEACEKEEPVTEVVETEKITTEDTPAVKANVAEEASTDSAEEIMEGDTPEPSVAEEDSSWFGWLWPFGDDDDEVAVDADVKEPVPEVAKTEDISAEDTPAVEEAVTEDVVEEVPEATLEETGDEPVVEAAVDSEENEGKGGIVNKLIYYFPNLLCDLKDFFSGKIGVGAKSGIELTLTRYIQLGGNYGDEYFVEKGVYRKCGGGYNNGYTFALGPLSSEKRYIDDVFGSIPSRIIKQSKATIQRPSDPFYKEKYRDYWAVGIDVGWLINLGLYLHPVEIADFFTGIFFYDLCDDNRCGVKDAKDIEGVEGVKGVENAEQASVDNETENPDEAAPAEDNTETSEKASDSDDSATEDNTETTSDDASDSGDTPSDEDFDF